jgi:hypothetical protein
VQAENIKDKQKFTKLYCKVMDEGNERRWSSPLSLKELSKMRKTGKSSKTTEGCWLSPKHSQGNISKIIWMIRQNC